MTPGGYAELVVGGVQAVDVLPTVFELGEVVFAGTIGWVVEVDLVEFYAAYHDIVSYVFELDEADDWSTEFCVVL